MRTLIATCLLLAATSVGWAADSQQQPVSAPSSPAAVPPASYLPYSWAGFYLRGSPSLAPGSGSAGGTNAITGLSGMTNSIPSNSAGIDTGMVGANWQNGSTVVGFEGDMQWTGQSAGPLAACGMG